MTREVWFQLVDGEGKAVTSADRVKELDDEAKVVDLRDAVFSKVSRALPANVIAADLTVFANRAAYDAKQALEEDSPIGSFGGSKKDALTVQVPKKEQRSVLWLVRGSIVNALSTKGVRCRLYRLAGTYLGYYDPARRTGDKDSALWYEDKTLCIHILFETKENALRFDNALQEEPVTLGSPLNGQEVTTSVAQVEGVQTELKRIYLIHYDPQESESPQDTMIEHERYFLPYGNAESCHLVSRKQSRDHKREFAKYDRDTNNRLALSREMHGFYDGLSYDVPIVNMIPGSVEQNRSIGNRYKVEVFVKVLDAQCKDRVFSRLKEGATQTDDPLVMKTFVHVEDPETFCFCMRWKHDDNDECWKNFLSMTPAAD
ncbi:TPA: hypothetical protein N0F65_007412 [Lagenidium giganteum]|uniref:CRN13-like protein n=1 Tax=Lagenidium giganteum TaxID=4803 RepID=A0AAV2ZIB6_9STRA|nr:TPA: hypothetical protein N0F65_007412 [Lagenidium giganteum]